MVDLVIGDLGVVVLCDRGQRGLLSPVSRGGAAEQRLV